MNQNEDGGNVEELTNLSASIVHSFCCFANLRFFCSVHNHFSCSYPMNWRAPLLTPTRARLVPLYKPAHPSDRYTEDSPSWCEVRIEDDISFTWITHAIDSGMLWDLPVEW